MELDEELKKDDDAEGDAAVESQDAKNTCGASSTIVNTNTPDERAPAADAWDAPSHAGIITVNEEARAKPLGDHTAHSTCCQFMSANKKVSSGTLCNF